MHKMCRTQCVLALVALFLGLAHSWDLALSSGDRLEFYTDKNKTDTVRFDSQNLTALAYDEVHNILLYVNKQNDNDTICGYNISSVEYKCYIEKSGRDIQGLAFDPITEMLFFTDTKERSINWISFKPGSENNVNGNLLIKMADGIPTDIAVDSCSGYIYWINTNLTTSTIERARFNGSEREVIIYSTSNWDLHSLAICQQTQKMYWFMPVDGISHSGYSADLNGTNKNFFVRIFSEPGDESFVTHPNTFTISNEFLIIVDWCPNCNPRSLWKYSKPPKKIYDYKSFLKFHSESPVGIAAKYKIREQIQGVQACKALASLVPNNYMTDDSLKIAREHVELFCVHGIKVSGQSLCKCTPGYIGERCDVSVCENYCLQGDCTFNEEGLSKCRCNAGYSGERCEVNVCHGYCSNNGSCSFNENNGPVCECVDGYAGDRCDVPVCLKNGDCSLNEEGSRCKADKNNTLSSTPTYYTAEKNQSIADFLLAYYRKPVTTISVVVEVKSN